MSSDLDLVPRKCFSLYQSFKYQLQLNITNTQPKFSVVMKNLSVLIIRQVNPNLQTTHPEGHGWTQTIVLKILLITIVMMNYICVVSYEL